MESMEFVAVKKAIDVLQKEQEEIIDWTGNAVMDVYKHVDSLSRKSTKGNLFTMAISCIALGVGCAALTTAKKNQYNIERIQRSESYDSESEEV